MPGSPGGASYPSHQLFAKKASSVMGIRSSGGVREMGVIMGKMGNLFKMERVEKSEKVNQ